MLTFWITALALSGLALAFVLPPLLKKAAPREDIDRNELNIAIYRERLAELRQDLEQGRLSPEHFEQSKEDMEKNLLQDVSDADATARHGGRWAALVVALLLPALALGGYWFSSDQQAFSPPPPPTTMGDLESMVNKLAERLKNEPDNTQGWTMLARSYRMLDRHQEAAEVYARLLEKAGGKDPELMTDYAEALALAADGQLAGKPLELLNQALALQTDLPKALWLSGMAAKQQNDAPRAIETWNKLLNLLPPDSEDAQTVREYLAELGEAGAPAAPSPDNAAALTPGATLEVRVSLSPELQARLKPEDTLFIYARAAEGPRMPLAIVKKQAKDLPLTVALDDSMSMMPALKLSTTPKVVAAARISPSGQATPQPGDWLGESAPLEVKPGLAVDIVINQEIPAP